MQTQLVLAALKKHRLASALIALEVALAFAVLCNACFLVAGKIGAMQLQSGVDEAALGMVAIDMPKDANARDVNARMLAGLSAIPGVESVHIVNSVPFGPKSGNMGISLDPTGQHSAGSVEMYFGGPGTPEAMGLTLLSGQMPTSADYQSITNGALPQSSRVLISQALASHLWPHQSPLGKIFWNGSMQFRVIGVVAHLAIQQYNAAGVNGDEYTAFVPLRLDAAHTGAYLIRSKRGEVTHVMAAARAAVPRIAPDVVLDRENSHSISTFRNQFFESDRAMVGLLVGVVLALLIVTALGIVGLANFWVSQRTRQIGIRRALGATYGDILRYFQLENLIIVSWGIAGGVVLSVAINLVLMRSFELTHLPLWYLPAGAVALWLLGQIAVLAPAMRAANVMPVIAMRGM